MATAIESMIAPPEIRQTKILINGEWEESASGKTFATINPATEEKITDVVEGDAEDVDRAVKAARTAFDTGAWSKMDARERGRLLFRVADLIEKNKEELARLESLDSGKPIVDSRAVDIPMVLDTFRYYAGWADKIHGDTLPVSGPFFSYTRKQPVGVCGQIIPWNFPLIMASWKIAPALCVGCTVVLKPAEQTPLTALRLGELILEAGLPPGVVNIVTGFGPTAGAPLVKHPMVDKIAFTGEYRTGQIIMRDAAETLKRITFELGGKGPNVVFADADLDAAVDGAFMGIYWNSGQQCCAGSRLFVEESAHAEFVEKLAAKTKQWKLGNPFDESTQQGPQIDQAQFDKIMGYIDGGKKAGAKCVTGGTATEGKGYYIQPTIFDNVTDEMKIAKEEIFGPVISVLPFKGIDEVVERSNNTFYGLAAAVWTQDVKKAHRLANQLRAGTVWVNCFGVFDIAAPFGGFKMSGFGREQGEKCLDNYTELKTVTMALS